MTMTNLLKPILHDVTEAAWGCLPVHEVRLIPDGLTPWSALASVRVAWPTKVVPDVDLLSDLADETLHHMDEVWVTEDNGGFRTLWCSSRRYSEELELETLEAAAAHGADCAREDYADHLRALAGGRA